MKQKYKVDPRCLKITNLTHINNTGHKIADIT